MKKVIEKIKPIGKLFGIIIGVFILWIVFGMITGNQSIKSNDLKNIGYNLSMPNNSHENYTGTEMMQEDSMRSKSMNFDSSSNRLITPPAGPALTEKKIIKNGDLTLKVDSTEKSAEEIYKIAKAQNGEIFSTNFYERIKGQKSGNIIVKVPVEKFETTLLQIKTVATQIISESTTGRDVTEQYSDLQVQSKNKQAEEESFIKILDRAEKIDDVLAITKQISRVRGEIERLEGRIRFMDSQTVMSTITINLSEDIELAPIKNNWRPWQVVKKSFSDLIANSQEFVNGLIRFFIVTIPSIIPFLIFLIAIYWISKKIRSRFKK